MRFPNFFAVCFAVAWLFAEKNALSAQTVLLGENFDGCELPAGWQVKIDGYQQAVWYVGASTNVNNPGETMNGSCCFVIDEDQTGDNTPRYVMDIISPEFDASLFPTVMLQVDVHYRDWNEAQESFKVILHDGTKEIELTSFDSLDNMGAHFSTFQTLRRDLSFFTKSQKARLIFRYDDGGDWDWWAAFDNVAVVGLGSGTNLLSETFNDCTMPAGWETGIVTGDQDWSFGKLENTKCPANERDMNGSCMAYFDDDIIGENAPYSVARLYSPWFNGSDYAQYALTFDLVHRYYKEIFRVFVQDASGKESLVREFTDDGGGPYFHDFITVALDLSPYRDKQMRVIFEYDDGQDYSWWSGIDNMKITADGATNDLCANALSLQTGAACTAGNNLSAVFDGDPAPCAAKSVGSLWYTWTADFTGVAKFTSSADFNDVLTVFTGGCPALQTASCHNRDEHGFKGEAAFFPVSAGTTYLLRLSGQDGGFGLPRGNVCARIENGGGFPIAPANDDCANAATLALGAPCANGTSLNAATSAQLPSFNLRARHDVWYKFTAQALPSPADLLEIRSNADFSDIITVYKGGCNNLQELAANHKGGALELPPLTAGQTYRVQISGTFATIEGNLCPQLLVKQANAPANDDCLTAQIVSIGATCTAGNNEFAAASTLRPLCAVSIERDIWFKFVAPASGTVRLNTGAEFEHVLAVWAGVCSDLEPVFCAKNPRRCDGFVTVGNLSPGQTYFVQIGTLNGAGTSGGVCLKILDANAQPDFVPLGLQAKETCNGFGTAEITLTPTNGVPPYTFVSVQNGQTLNSGEYYIAVVSDAMDCETSLIGLVDSCIESACNLSASLTVTHPRCHGEQNGALAATLLGGTAPYIFSWSNGASEPSLSNLAPGTYTCTATDAEGCDIVISETLTDPAALVASVSATTQPIEGQGNGSIEVLASGGTGSLAFQWTRDGQPFSALQNLANLPGGNYALTVTDANGCTQTLMVELKEIVGATAPAEDFFAEIFPNPTRERATLSVSLPDVRDLDLALVEASGRVLRAWSVPKVSEQNIALDLKNLPSGRYELRLQAGNLQVVKRVVVVD